MKIILNGQPFEVTAPYNLTQILGTMEKLQSPFAVAINEHFVSRCDYQNTQLQDHDRLDIIIPMQGG